jgi:hypothetical protein
MVEYIEMQRPPGLGLILIQIILTILDHIGYLHTEAKAKEY